MDEVGYGRTGSLNSRTKPSFLPRTPVRLLYNDVHEDEKNDEILVGDLVAHSVG